MRLENAIELGKAIIFQSTHPLRDATLILWLPFVHCMISIHAPLTGCDFNRTLTKVNPVISIHAPLTGCDPAGLLVEFFLLLFQSTHPLRDATASFSFLSALIIYFNPRTPYGMRQG